MALDLANGSAVANALRKGLKRWSKEDELAFAQELIGKIIDEFPRRQPTSQDERDSQLLMKEIFEALGLKTELHEFEFNDNLYANLVLHFGLGTLGSLVGGLSPQLAFALHSLVAGSYWADSRRKGYVLRRLLGFKPSQNILATLPAESKPKLRIVIGGHADAAFTGFLFSPWAIQHFTGDMPKQLEFIKRSLALATRTEAALAATSLIRSFIGPFGLPLRPLELLLSLPSFIAFLLALDVVIRDKVVPGANDNLTAGVALPILAARLAAKKHNDVEIVFLVTGCEEASLGGADALIRDKSDQWDKDSTVFLALDSLTNGELHFLDVEGEVVKTPIPQWLRDVTQETIASNEAFSDIKGFEVPVGGSDAASWLARGRDAIALTCVDSSIGAPRHYHQPTDDLEHLEIDKLPLAFDFAEALTEAIIRRKLG